MSEDLRFSLYRKVMKLLVSTLKREIVILDRLQNKMFLWRIIFPSLELLEFHKCFKLEMVTVNLVIVILSIIGFVVLVTGKL